MRPLLWVVLALTPVTITLQSSAHAADFHPVRITEVYLTPPGPYVGTQQVELTNISFEPVDIGGWCLRSNNKATEFDSGTVLMPGQVFVIHIGAEGLNDGSNHYTGHGFPSLRRFWGSLELHRANWDFLNPELLADYVNWGGPHHMNAAVAEEAGLWKHGEYLPADGAPGFSYQFCDRVKPGAAAWQTAAAQVGVLNVCLLDPTPVQETTWGKVKALYAN